MIVVTGAAGFIGSNIIKALNERGRTDIVAVDDMTDGSKFENLLDCEIADYFDVEEFREIIRKETLLFVSIFFHNGACSSTTRENGKQIMDNNFTFSKELFEYCQRRCRRLIYASSASVYGHADQMAPFSEDTGLESPLNLHAYSKLLFDQHVQKFSDCFDVQIVGLRYFNVYGPGEQHKGSRASVAYQIHTQMLGGERPRLFGAYDGFEEGLQCRDFVHVDDVVAANLWFFDNGEVSGTFNVGTGRAEPFVEVANAVINYYGGKREIEFIEFPDSLKRSYQSYTCADTSKLREAGFQHEFKTVAKGVREYMEWLNRKRGATIT